MNIEDWKKALKGKTKEELEKRLTEGKEKIAFLESIYEGGGANHFYSREFEQAAVKERQSLCQFTSAIYSLLCERG